MHHLHDQKQPFLFLTKKNYVPQGSVFYGEVPEDHKNRDMCDFSGQSKCRTECVIAMASIIITR